MTSYSERLASWTHALNAAELPEDLREATKLRVLDVIGLALAGTATNFGKSLLRATLAMSPAGPCRLIGSGEAVSVTSAAFVNGALAQALEFDDTHNESIVHMSAPAVSTALALAQTRQISGSELIGAIALGNEISCRVGVVAPGQFHRRGFHPTGLFAVFGATYLAGRLLGLTPAELTNAAGIAGSYASGILECWVDGTQSKFLHPGWAAQSGIIAAHLAHAGTTGPKTVFEGRFGLIQSHLQDPEVPRAFDRIVDGLGVVWESAKASFKPFPAAHVIHPYIDAVLRLRREHGIDPRKVRDIFCPVAGYIVPVVCEPVAEKRRPRSDSHGRVSLQYTLAEALLFGRLGKDAYRPENLDNPEILRLTDCVRYQVDSTFPGPERYKGVVRITMADGTIYEAIEENNRGSAANPMSLAELTTKFEENAATSLKPAQIEGLRAAVLGLETMADAGKLLDLAIAGR